MSCRLFSVDIILLGACLLAFRRIGNRETVSPETRANVERSEAQEYFLILSSAEKTTAISLSSLGKQQINQSV